jgi:hypothetical protein
MDCQTIRSVHTIVDIFSSEEERVNKKDYRQT